MAVKPKLAMIPSGVGTDTLYSVLPSSGVGDFYFSRSNQTATRVNKDGLIELVDSNVPRLNYPLIDGVVSGCPSLLLEPARTNLVTNYNDFTSWANSGSYITADYGISPDGTQNASRCLFTNTNQTLSKNIGTNGTLSYSIYVKGVKGETINISMASGSDENFTLNGEWQRLSYSDTVTNATININTFGDKTARDLLIFGAQLEVGSYSTSIIPTSGSTATRSAETCNNAGDVNTFNDSEGVLMAEIAKNKGSQYSLISLFKSSVSDTYIYMGYLNNTTTIRGQIKVGGTTVLDEEIEMADTNITAKVSVRYKSGDYSLYVNGLEVGSSSSTAIFTDGDLNEMQFGFANNSIFDFYGNTKQIQYFDTALTDTDLEELTSWTSFNEMANAQLYTIL